MATREVISVYAQGLSADEMDCPMDAEKYSSIPPSTKGRSVLLQLNATLNLQVIPVIVDLAPGREFRISKPSTLERESTLLLPVLSPVLEPVGSLDPLCHPSTKKQSSQVRSNSSGSGCYVKKSEESEIGPRANETCLNILQRSKKLSTGNCSKRSKRRRQRGRGRRRRRRPSIPRYCVKTSKAKDMVSSDSWFKESHWNDIMREVAKRS